MNYSEQTFTIPELVGISERTVEEHKKLYAGYVKHTNLILDKITELSKDSEANAYVLGELQRRFSFEFDGMRNHEYYFENLENGTASLNTENDLAKAIEAEWGSLDTFIARFKAIAMTRGIGWAVLYYDAKQNKLVTAWVEEQHLGHLNGLTFILGLDMWEHSYMLDYAPSEKKKYVEAFFANLNWSPSENRFAKAKA
jgi:Fe-Mn family superoxide dismutase